MSKKKEESATTEYIFTKSGTLANGEEFKIGDKCQASGEELKVLIEMDAVEVK